MTIYDDNNVEDVNVDDDDDVVGGGQGADHPGRALLPLPEGDCGFWIR